MDTCKPLLQRLIESTLFLVSFTLCGPTYSSCMSEAEKLQVKQEIRQSTGLSQKALESFLETEDPNLSITGAWFNHFHAAFMYRHSTIIPLMIKCGADVNKEDGAGRTPLRVAISQQDLDTLTALLSGKPALEMSFYRNSRFDNDLFFYAISDIKAEHDLHLLEALIRAGMKVTNADLKRVHDKKRVAVSHPMACRHLSGKKSARVERERTMIEMTSDMLRPPLARRKKPSKACGNDPAACADPTNKETQFDCTSHDAALTH
ncbi:MAG: hypothetical protein R3F47_16950 [Gammaproteobacteria bacterium]